MSVSFAQNKVSSCRRDLQRHRDKQAHEEARAARFDREAARYEGEATRSSSDSTIRSKLRLAQGKRGEAIRAREAAAKASKAVADSQKKLHEAEASLSKEVAAEERRAHDRERRERQRAERARQAQDRQERDRERAREGELTALRMRADDLEATLRAVPWAQAPTEIDVLFVAASPEDQTPLRLDKEVREIQQRVRMSEYRDAVTFHWRPASQTTDLLQALNEVRPHIVHFSGHGSQSALIFEDDDGRAKELDSSDLAHLLRISSDRIRLAIFNSCESADRAALACAHIDTAIGMDDPVNDHAAKVFAGQFYNALAFGKSVSQAFEQAKLQMKLDTGSTAGGPRLHAAPGIDPDSVYLVRPDRDERAA